MASIKSLVLGTAVVTTGLVAGGSVIADSAYRVKRHTEMKTNNELATDIADVYLGDLSSSSESITTTKAQKWYTKHMLSAKTVPKLIYAKNAVLSFGGEIVKNIVPLALSVGAVLLPFMGKGKIGKAICKTGAVVCAATLIISKGGKFISDVTGWGKQDPMPGE